MPEIVLLNDTSSEEHWGCESAGGEILRATQALPNISKVHRYSVQYSWQFKPCPDTLNQAHNLINESESAFAGLIENIATSSLVVVNAEGTLLSNRIPVRNLLTFLLIVIKNDKPFVILNATINPYAMKVGRNKIEEICSFYRFVLPYAHLITVRESRSYHIARCLGARQVWHGYDASLNTFSESRFRFAHDKLPICVIFGSVRINKKHCKRLERFLEMFRQRTGCQFVVCAMTRQEIGLLKKLSRNLDCRFEDSNTFTLEDLKELLDRSFISISGRYHGCLLSAARIVPFIHYETHSERLKDFCHHLCYEWGEIKLFGNSKINENIEIATKVWSNQHSIRKFLYTEMPFVIEKSKIHVRELSEIWKDLSGGECPQCFEHKTEMAELFLSRAEVAAKMLPRGLRILDVGGFKQSFGRCYSFKSYISIDQLHQSQSSPLGQPSEEVMVTDLPFPNLHREANINNIRNYSFAQNFDVAVFLGVFPWLHNWMNTLKAINKADISKIIVSWDQIEINRVGAFLHNLSFTETKRVQVNEKSVISLFEKRKV